MKIQTKRYFDDPEDNRKDYYAIFNKNTGALVQLTGAPSFKVPMECLIKEAMANNTISEWDEVEQKYTYRPGLLGSQNLVVVYVEDNEMADDWAFHFGYRGKTFLDLVDNTTHLAEKLAGKPIRATNRKNETGIPKNHPKRVSIVKNKNKKTFREPNTKAVIVQNVAMSRAPALNPEAKTVDIQNEINTVKATKLQIVFKGKLLSPGTKRKIFCIRLDGKLVGRYFPSEDETEIECTWFDYCRGDHMYQIQLDSPIENDEIEDYSLIIEEL